LFGLTKSFYIDGDRTTDSKSQTETVIFEEEKAAPDIHNHVALRVHFTEKRIMRWPIRALYAARLLKPITD
jgi:hypothetical protein